MVELQIINKIIASRSIDILTRNRLTAENFLVEGDKIEFILSHLRTYRAVPDSVTMLSEFPDFPLIDTDETEEFLVKKIKEAQLFARIVPIIKEASNQIRDDSFTGMEFLRSQLDAVARDVYGQASAGTDIVARSRDRLTEFQRRAAMHGIMGITTGIQLLDQYTHGWLPEDLILIYARTNEGKSWLLMFFLVAAWAAGRKVLLYSGEMSDILAGFRFDTVSSHFNNRALMGGQTQLGDARNEQIGSRNVGDYENYVNDLQRKHPFIVVTQKDFGGKKPTVDDLRQMMDQTGSDILGVDQISLMADQRKAKDKRERYTNIAEDLYLLTEEIGKPIIAVGQANRDAVKGKKKGDQETPELHEVAESDGLVQNSTRCLAMKVVNNVLRVSIKKNRYGINNKDVLMLWDINLGIFTPMLDDQTPEQTNQDFGF